MTLLTRNGIVCRRRRQSRSVPGMAPGAISGPRAAMQRARNLARSARHGCSLRCPPLDVRYPPGRLSTLARSARLGPDPGNLRTWAPAGDDVCWPAPCVAWRGGLIGFGQSIRPGHLRYLCTGPGFPDLPVKADGGRSQRLDCSGRRVAPRADRCVGPGSSLPLSECAGGMEDV